MSCLTFGFIWEGIQINSADGITINLTETPLPSLSCEVAQKS